MTPKKNGFKQPDPSQMGLDMPDWLNDATETEVDARPSRSASGSSAPPTSSARTLLEGMKVVCICKGIKMRTFWRAMDDGAQTHEQIDKATGSGSGQCQGRRCGPRILEMLRNLSR
jgi:bacterioferritin-associated ferredoxin